MNEKNSSQIQTTNLRTLATLSDAALYDLCQKYGKNAKTWLRKFAMLLPEVHKRGLYRRKRFATIHEFSACLSGMNYATTDQILSLFRVLEDKPILRSLVEEYGWSKVRVVGSIATPTTEKFWAEKIKILPKSALEVYVRELREQEERKLLEAPEHEIVRRNSNDREILNVEIVPNYIANLSTKIYRVINGDVCQIFPGEKLQSVKNTQIPLLGNIYENVHDGIDVDGGADNDTANVTKSLAYAGTKFATISLRLDEDTEFKLKLLRQTLERKTKQAVTFGEAIKYIFEEHEKSQNVAVKPMVYEKSQNKKPAKSTKPATVKQPTSSITTTPSSSQPLSPQKTFSRYIPACIRRELAEKYHYRCAYPNCRAPAAVIHHSERFAVTKTHDARTMKPLCAEHHDLAHAALIKDEQAQDSQDWSVSQINSIAKQNNVVDKKYLTYKKL